MTPYSPVDAIIKKWASSHGHDLITTWGGVPARLIYLSGSKPSEFAQIIIAPPQAEKINVSAWFLDEDDGRHCEASWDKPLDELEGMLNEAAEAIKQWFS